VGQGGGLDEDAPGGCLVIELRPHQTRGIGLCRRSYRAGRSRVLAVAPTGAGKTILFCWIAASAVQRGGRVLVVVHRRELVGQTVAKMRDAGLARVGVVQSGERGDPDAPVQVASVQTLLARVARAGRSMFGDSGLPAATLLVLDEAHHYVADKWAAIAAHYKDAKILGVTATPERGDGAPLGDLFEELLPLASVRELTDAGYLVPCDVIAPPAKRRSNCEDPVDAYVRLAPGRKAVVFASSVKDAYELASRYAMAGFPAACIEGDMAADERDSALARFAAGELVVLVNVFVLTEGWDCPSAEVCILARGCSHVGTYLQMVGRVLRCHPGKTRALLIDLRGAVHKHDLPSADRTYSLEGRAISAGEAPTKVCKACGVLSPIAARVCAACGAEFPPPPAEAPMLLSRVEAAAVESTFFGEQYEAAVRRGSTKPAGYAAHRFVEKYGRFPAKFWREHGGPEERSRSIAEAS